MDKDEARALVAQYRMKYPNNILSTLKHISIEPCACGHPGCRDYWLVGIGFFCQGSGFSKEAAQFIADTLNEAREHYALTHGPVV